MEPIWWLILFLAAAVAIAVVAHKRGRSWWLAFGATVVGGLGMAILSSLSSRGTTLAGGWLAPAIVLFWVLSARNSEEIAQEHGSHGGYKKCPFCAESVRREAIKCKHCGSDLTCSPSPAVK